MVPTSRTAARAFTLVELLVVIGIIAVLVGILLPTLNKARKSSTQVVCTSNLAQIRLGLAMYANDNRDHYPNPTALGDGAVTVTTSPHFRAGINELVPTSTDPNAVETLGLHNLLFRLNYVKSPEVWICPGFNTGKFYGITQRSSYSWQVTKYNSAYTSKKRAVRPPPVNPSTNLPPADPNLAHTYAYTWGWYVQDNVSYNVYTTNKPGNGATATSVAGYASFPHAYQIKQTDLQNGTRKGSINVLFIDGSISPVVFKYNPTTLLSQTIIRD